MSKLRLIITPEAADVLIQCLTTMKEAGEENRYGFLIINEDNSFAFGSFVAPEDFSLEDGRLFVEEDEEEEAAKERINKMLDDFLKELEEDSEEYREEKKDEGGITDIEDHII
jgi:hypothetical protein